MPLSATSIRRRYLVLRAIRNLPAGLLVPILVLTMLDRGLSLGQVGIAAAAFGIVVLALELPTGGMADAVGRRLVLMAATFVEIIAVALFIFADAFALFVLVQALRGLYRALDTGPLDAWYVDAAQEVDQDADIEAGLSAGGVAMGVATASGALLTAGIVIAEPLPMIDALVAPLLLAVLVRVAEIVMLAVLMVEHGRPRSARDFGESIRNVPSILRGSVLLVRRSRVLLALVAVSLFWGFGLAAVELLSPAKMANTTGTVDDAAVLFGMATAAVWLTSAVGSALVPYLTRRLGAPLTAVVMRVLQGATVIAMALLGGVAGFMAAYLATYLINGTSDAVHDALLHRQVGPAHRASVISIDSMMYMAADAAAVVAFGLIAESASITTALLVGGLVLVIAAPLYLPAHRKRLAMMATS